MKDLKIWLTAFLFITSASITTLSAKDWQVDYSASSIGFRVESRLGDVDGTFHRWKYEGQITESLGVKGKIVVDIASIDTRNQKRDDHLRDPDFFETGKYPTAVFMINKLEKKSNYYILSGTLKIRDQVKPVKFKLKTVKQTDSFIQLKSLFILDRTDFGITYNSFINPMEDEIMIRIHLTLKK